MLNMSSSRESLSKIVRQLIDQTQGSSMCMSLLKALDSLFYHEFMQLSEKEAFQNYLVGYYLQCA